MVRRISGKEAPNPDPFILLPPLLCIAADFPYSPLPNDDLLLAYHRYLLRKAILIQKLPL
jgi:hypothetical protein